MPKARILQPTQENLASLSTIAGDDRCILTVYFPGSASSEPAGPVDKSVIKAVAELSEADNLSEDEREHAERCLSIWEESMKGVSLKEAPAWVGVVSWLTGDVALVPLPGAVEIAAHMDNSPFLYPAGRLLDDRESYVVAYMDHGRAVIYVASLGKLEEEDRLRGDIKNHVRKGGWSQQRYERRRDKQIHEFCEKLAERLRTIVDAEELRRVVLVGDKQLVAEFQRHLSDQENEWIIAVMASENDADEAQLYASTFERACEEEKREEQRLLKQILASQGQSGRAATGPRAVLDALRSHRAHTLLVGPMDEVLVWRCRECGRFGLGDPQSCPDCKSRDGIYPQDAANELADLAYQGGCTVEFTTESLDEIDGVGVLLRW